jgi:hypothetical protein
LALANVIDSVRPREEHELVEYAIKLYVAKKILGRPSQEETIKSLRQDVR